MSRRGSDRQLDLFAEPEAPAAPEAAPPVDPELDALGRALPPRLRLGTSSWTFPAWAGLVYHRDYRNERAFRRESLAEYARHPLFRTVGIDRSYYAPVPAEELASYAAQLPEGFECVSKVWSEITTRVFPSHPRFGDRAGQPNPHFLDPEVFAREVAEPTQRGLGAHAGPFVVEIPPAPGPVEPEGFAAQVERFLAGAPGGFRYAFELRDRRLFTDRYLDVLQAHGATHVFNYWARMPSIRQQRARRGSLPGPFVVARLMLPPGQRYDDLKRAYAPFDRIVKPQPEMRADTVALIEEALQREMDVYVVVNNKAEGSSPLTVRALAEAVVARPHRAGRT